jgi:serine/threonine protein kinase
MSVSLDPMTDKVLGGRYKLIRVLGRGASGSVWLASDILGKQLVAAKILNPGLRGDQGFLKRFLYEAEVASGLSHLNVIKIYHWGTDDDQPYLVTELADGGSLRNILDKCYVLNLSQVLLMSIQAAKGLVYAHSRGIVHADIKPANILFTVKRVLKIADFGLSRAFGEAAWTEPAGSLLGTARYSSPEQAMGKRLTDKSDIYSLGVVMYECLTGQIPFAADTTIATLTGRIGKKFPENADLGLLEDAIMMTGDPEPSKRPTAKALLEMLEEVASKTDPCKDFPLAKIDTSEVAADQAKILPPPPLTRRPRYKKQRSWLFASILFLLIAAIGLLSYFVYNFEFYPKVVPNLDRQSLTQAKAELAALGLKAKINYSYSNSVPASYVIFQNPSAGVRTKDSATVTLEISKGKYPVKIPGYSAGENYDNYAKTLKSYGFKIKAVPEYTLNYPLNEIINVNPTPGSMLQPGMSITITYSNGPPFVTIPSFSGLSATQYISKLNSLNLKLNEVTAYSNTVGQGQVISTNPSPGTSLRETSSVTVTVSLGPQLVTVPNLTGLTIDQAYNQLTSIGLTYGGSTGRSDIVKYSDPPAGSQVPVGTQVNLYT